MKLSPGHFSGVLKRKRQVPGFTLVECTYAPKTELPPHSHESAYCSFVLDGSYQEEHDFGSRTCTVGTVAFHPPGEVHSDKFCSSGGRILNLEIGRQNLQRLDEFDMRKMTAVFTTGPMIELGIRLLKAFSWTDAAATLAIEGLGLEVLSELCRAKPLESSSSAWMKDVVNFLCAHFNEPLSPVFLAESVGVHPARLAREFRRRYKCTIRQYVHRLRIEYACREMSVSRAPLAQIALAAGFCHQSHFSNSFRRLLGTTPAEFRRSGWRRPLS
jgi:AraC family transcriptional regulator